MSHLAYRHHLNIVGLNKTCGCCCPYARCRNPVNTVGVSNPKMSVLIQKCHLYTGHVNSETPGDSTHIGEMFQDCTKQGCNCQSCFDIGSDESLH